MFGRKVYIFSILLASAVSLALGMAGCTSQKETPSKAEISIWHWMTDREPAFQELAKRYQEKTGIKITFI